MPVGTMYRYFPSKEALIHDLYKEIKLQMVADMLRGFDPAQPLRERFFTLWSNLFDYYRANPQSFTFMRRQYAGSALPARAEVVDVGGDAAGPTRDFFEEGYRRADPEAPAPEILYALMVRGRSWRRPSTNRQPRDVARAQARRDARLLGRPQILSRTLVEKSKPETSMKYQQLGSTGLFVSRLTLGTMTFGGAGTIFGAIGGLEQKEADALVGRALDAGVNFIDTANIYAAGESEIITGKALGKRRNEVVLATKVHGRMGKGANEIGLSRYHHHGPGRGEPGERLGTDHIDLYQIHGYDHVTPIEETLRALDDLVRQGKVRYIGCSNQAAWHIMKARSAPAPRIISRNSFRCRPITRWLAAISNTSSCRSCRTRKWG